MGISWSWIGGRVWLGAWVPRFLRWLTAKTAVRKRAHYVISATETRPKRVVREAIRRTGVDTRIEYVGGICPKDIRVP
jgi:hypothetical protein